MPGFFINSCNRLANAGIGAVLGTLQVTTNMAAYSLGDAIIPTGDKSGLGAAVTQGAAGGAIVGTVAGAIFVDRQQNSGLSQNQYVQKIAPFLPVLLPVASNVIGDLINQAMGTNCVEYYRHSNTHYEYECKTQDTFLSHNARASMVGNAIIWGGVTILAYVSYKLICRQRPQDERAEAPYQVLAGEEKQPAVNLTLRQRLEACYDGEIPNDFRDAIHLELMNYPIVLHCGDSFDQESLPQLQETCPSCPKCRASFRALDFSEPTPNTYLRNNIIEFVEGKEKLAREIRMGMPEGEEGIAVVVADEENLAREIRMDIVEGEEGVSAMIADEEKLVPPILLVEQQDISELVSTNKQKLLTLGISLNSINRFYICSLSHQIMDKPVRASDRQVYERAALIEYIFDKQNQRQPVLSPVTQEPLTCSGGRWFVPANDIQILIERFFREKTAALQGPVSFFRRSLGRNEQRHDANLAQGFRR